MGVGIKNDNLIKLVVRVFGHYFSDVILLFFH